nr:MAG TPA: hypothetical protein [Caudoviricetes sp.]
MNVPRSYFSEYEYMGALQLVPAGRLLCFVEVNKT